LHARESSKTNPADPQSRGEDDCPVERDAGHQQSIETQMIQHHSKVLDCKETLAARGQWIGLALTIFLSGASVILGLKGHDWLAAIICTTTIVAVVTIFVLQRVIGDANAEDDTQPSDRH
jgi:general stress protein CsbA